VYVEKGDCLSFDPTRECFLGGAGEREKPRRGKYNRERERETNIVSEK
jgi:hypothetical protein